MIEDKLGKTEIEQMNTEQLRIISDNFTRELHNARSGKKTSLAFVIHELSPSPIVKDGETFQSIVIGGTVGEIATLKKTGNAIQILDKKEEQLSFRTEDEFFDFISRNLSENTNILTLNFAQALKPIFEDGKLDGILLTVAKEKELHGLVGKQIGKEIESYVLAKKNKKIKVAVANDTVCLLTSGLDKFQEEELAGGIVGTGLNFAFFPDKNKLANLESGSFDKFPLTGTGRMVDEKSSQPGSDFFEKETAGAYLYRHFNFILKEKGINFPNITSTEELDKISRENIPQISEIAQNLISRSAQLVSCQIAGLTNYKKTNMTFIMEGSLFWKGNNYKETVEKTTKQLAPEYQINFVEIKNSTILGAAKLVS